jgi:hypothetical protein
MSPDVVVVNVGAAVVIGWIIWYFWMSRTGD